MSAVARQESVIDGFAAVTLRNAEVAVTVVPALGARIVSLRSVSGGREWIWRPDDERGLFACASNTPFENSTLAGVDECFPSVLPCMHEGVAIPDHGEVWSREWTQPPTPDRASVITTLIELRTLPLVLQRRLRLDAGTVRLDYTLVNRSAQAVPYLWAFHPLFTLEPTDEIVLGGTSDFRVTAAIGSQLADGDRGPWPSPRPGVRLDRTDLGSGVARADSRSCLKGFLATADAPTIALVDRARGEQLMLGVNPAEISAWGYWVSLGAWHGHTHLALEPTNAAANGLDELTPGPASHPLAPQETRRWTVTLGLSALPPLTR